MPDDGEVAGLLALMLLTEARRTARVSASGELVTLAEQDREARDAGLGRGQESRAAYGKAIELAGNTAEIAYLTRRRDQVG
jgi:predicted RNA polymerase sigma factor